jgi:hypothetical protein
MITSYKKCRESAHEAVLAIGFFIFLAFPIQVFPVSFEKEFGNKELYVELEDPYYFPAGLYCSNSGRGDEKMGAELL